VFERASRKFACYLGAKKVRAYLALSQNDRAQGQFLFCLDWAKIQIETNNDRLVRIYRFRMGEPIGRLIAEVGHDGIHLIEGFVLADSMLAKSRG